MTHQRSSPTIYRTRSWTSRQRVLIATGGLGLLFLGYLLGRWQDSPASAPATKIHTSAVASNAAEPSLEVTEPAPTPIAYAVLQAEAANELAGIEKQDTQDEGGGQNVGWIKRGDHLRFDNFDFGEVPAVKARVRLSSGQDGTSRLELRLDSPTNPPIGGLTVSNTGGWQNWRTATAAIEPVTGVHTVYVAFARDDDIEFVNLNWLKFDH